MANRTIAGIVAAGVIGVAAAAGIVAASNSTSTPTSLNVTFDSPADFTNNFDFGYSGPNPWDWGNGSGDGAITNYPGDHAPTADGLCAGPTTVRNVFFTGDRQNLGYDNLFWWCGPGGPSTGHIMTGVNTVSYNYAWFATKAMYSNISQVCWAINETEMSHRKWTEIMFVGAADAVRYPAGGPTGISSNGARGSGGYDLGFTNPNSRDPNGATTGIFPQGGTLAGLEDDNGSVSWFQNQDTWMVNNAGSRIEGVTDKATRYKHCLTNQSDNTILLTMDTPTGQRNISLPGQIPQDARKVVFQDNNYNPPKDSFYNEANLTWHWDDIQVTSGAVTPPPSTSSTVPTTTTTLPPTAPTTAPTTTLAPTTTVPPTTTQPSTTTTVAPTTTLPPTTTTIPPIPACPSTFSASEKVWCQRVMQHIASLEAKVL